MVRIHAKDSKTHVVPSEVITQPRDLLEYSLRDPSASVGTTQMLSFPDMNEAQIVISMQSVVFATPWMLTVAVVCARWLIFADLALGAWLLKSRKPDERHAVFEAAWASGLALVATTLLSHFVDRARPFLADPHALLLIPPPFNTSFPSGHTATAVAIACALWFVNRDIGIIAFVIAAFVAVSRIAVGVHYPTDILGGIAVGIVSFAFVRLIHRELARHDVAQSAKQHHHDA